MRFTCSNYFEWVRESFMKSTSKSTASTLEKLSVPSPPFPLRLRGCSLLLPARGPEAPRPRDPRPGRGTRRPARDPGPAHPAPRHSGGRVGVSRAQQAGQSVSPPTSPRVGRSPVDRDVPSRRPASGPPHLGQEDSPAPAPSGEAACLAARRAPLGRSRNPQTWPCVASGSSPRPSANHGGGGLAGPAPPPAAPARCWRLQELRLPGRSGLGAVSTEGPGRVRPPRWPGVWGQGSRAVRALRPQHTQPRLQVWVGGCGGGGAGRSHVCGSQMGDASPDLRPLTRWPRSPDIPHPLLHARSSSPKPMDSGKPSWASAPPHLRPG